MAALNISANQAAILAAMQNPISQSESTGVSQGNNPVFGALVPGWSKLTTAQQQLAIDGLRQTFIMLVAALNIDQIGVGTAAAPVVISYDKSPSGSGTLTFVGGLLVAFT